MADNNKTTENGYIEFRLDDFFRIFRKFWWLVIALTLAVSAVMCLRVRLSYVPMYESSATFTVQTQRVGNGISSYAFYYDRSTASQLEATFPSIIRSNILGDMIKNDMDISYIPASLSASSVKGANMFTLTARGTDKQSVYDVLVSAVKNYPIVSEYIIGSVKLDILTEPEYPEEPYNTPSYARQALRGGLIGAALGLFVLVLLTVSRKTVRSKEDIRTMLNQKTGGSIPEVTFKKYNTEIDRSVLITNGMVSNSFLESVRALRNNVLDSAEHEKNGNIIMLTSTSPGEGKTTIAANLALSAARGGKKVLLVDGDLRNPSVAAVLSLESGEIGKNADYRISHEETYGIDVLLFDTSREKIRRIVRVEYMKKLFDSLVADYDLIIVDTSPAGLTSDPVTISQTVGAVIFVVKQDFVRASRIIPAIDSLKAAGANVIGCVLNGSHTLYSGYGYSRYGYGYGYGYGQKGRKEKKS